MDFKLKYFENRNIIHSKNARSRSASYATREINTFATLLRLSKITHHLDWKGKKFLDLGAGDQFLRVKVSDLGAKYHPIDYDQADFNKDKLPFREAEFDIVFSLAVIEHLQNIDNYLNEVFRILKPGGIFYISTPNFRYCYKSFYNDPTHIRPFTEVSINKALSIFGFGNVNVFPGTRCKSDWFYTNKLRFFISAYMPFTGERWFLPSILSGRATSVIAICLKPT